MSRKKSENKKIRKKYQVTGEQLIKQGKLDLYHHLKDWVDILEERKQNQTDWWKKMSL